VITATSICTSTLERAKYTDKVKTGNAKMMSGRKKARWYIRFLCYSSSVHSRTVSLST